MVESGGYHPGSEGTGSASPGLPLSLQADPAPAPSPPPDPSSLTVLQPPPGSFQPTPAFTHHYTGSGSGVSDYTYSSPYTQYTTSPYGSYSYSTGAGGLLSK
ncbi:Paired box protein Pax-5 [Homalodisca vitripennis]|nr:Paired box protein Pax-5 [Homalodisca vitripennis]